MFSASQFSRRTGIARITRCIAASFAGAMVLTLICGCINSAPSGGPVVVPLTFTPEHANDSIKPYPGQPPQTKIYVGAFEDRRDKPDAIGANVEHSTPVPILAGSSPVEFFRHTLAAQLKQAGLNIVENPLEADRVITGDLTHFWVEESSNYQAEIAATIRVADKGGMVRWTGAVSGHGENFGRSLSPDNYRQTLSDAMVRLIYDSLIPNPEFQAAIK